MTVEMEKPKNKLNIRLIRKEKKKTAIVEFLEKDNLKGTTMNKIKIFAYENVVKSWYTLNIYIKELIKEERIYRIKSFFENQYKYFTYQDQD